MPCRKAEDAAWEAHKNAILDLYVTQNLFLKDVIKIMAARGFSRSKPQYERIFKHWNLSKNVHSHEWQFIFRRLWERDRRGKLSTVKVRGQKISKARLNKERPRQGYLKVHEQHELELHRNARPRTPPGVEVFTPPSSPSLTPPPSQEAPIEIAEGPPASPWWSDLNQLSTSKPENTAGLEQFSARQDWMTEIIGDLHADLNNVSQETQHNHRDVVAYTDIAETIQNSPQIQLVRVFGHVMRKTVDSHSAVLAVVRLTRNEACLEVLRRWLDLPNIPLIPHFASQVLIPAARDGHVRLVKTLLECGVDPNQKIQVDGHGGKVVRTALQYAIFNRREDLTGCLLQYGATDWRADIDAAEGTVRGTLLDAIIERTSGKQQKGTDLQEAHVSQSIDRSIFEMILKSKPRGAYSVEERSLRTLRLAVLRDRLDYVNLLLRHMPELKDDAQKHPWILLEAAASVQGRRMLQNLIQLGMDVQATNSAGFGSALASAVSHSNNSLIQHLINLLRVDPNTLAFGLGERRVQDPVFRSEERLEKLHGLAPLHIAVQQNDENAVDLLLSNGASPNLDCGAYPIQVAAFNGNVVILEKLLATGANLGAISSNKTLIALDTSNGRDTLEKLCASCTALQIAFKRGFMPAVDILLRRGGQLQPDVEKFPLYRVSSGMTSMAAENQLSPSVWDPLHIAVRERNRDMVRYVLAEMYGDTSKPGQLVHVINAHKQDDVATELIRIGSLADRTVCQLAVVCAGIMLRKTVLVHELLSQTMSAYVGAPPHHARRALILAIRERQDTLAFVFLATGLNPFNRIIPEEDGLEDLDEHFMFWRSMSAFECAVEYNRIDILETLLRQRSDHRRSLDAQRQLGEAYGTAICTDNRRLRSLILDAGLRKDKIDDTMGQNGYIGVRLYSELLRAAQAGDLVEVEWCIEKGAKPDPQHFQSEDTTNEWTPLQSAAVKGNLSMAKILLRAGADVNAPPARRHGRTALQAASEEGKLELVKLLLECKADVNALPSPCNGRTAIEAAAGVGHLATLIILLEHGADIRGKHNENYRRSAYRAYNNGHDSVVKFIQSWKAAQYGGEDCEAIANILQTTKLADGQEAEDEVGHADGSQDDYEDAVIEIEDDSCSSDSESYLNLNHVVMGN